MGWFVQMSLALSYLHSKKILHRDLKPANIFLSEGKRVIKLGDFGVTKVLSNTLPMAKTKIGTPYYMAPELLLGDAYNYKADVWSLGCVLYELAALAVPFQAQKMTQLQKRIVSEQPPPLSSRYSVPFEILTLKMLTKEPAARPGTKDLLINPFVRSFLRAFVAQHSRQVLDDARAGENELRLRVFDYDDNGGHEFLGQVPAGDGPLSYTILCGRDLCPALLSGSARNSLAHFRLLSMSCQYGETGASNLLQS